MGRKPLGDKPLTPAERQAKRRGKRTQEADRHRMALKHIIEAKTKRDADRIAVAALNPEQTS